MREKLQIINGEWWFLHGDHWTPLNECDSSMSRAQVREAAADQIEKFRQTCAENLKHRYVEPRRA